MPLRFNASGRSRFFCGAAEIVRAISLQRLRSQL
jgi:hypothetical protein